MRKEKILIAKAVRKQKTKKVIYEDIGYDDNHDENIYACTCPSCGLHLIVFSDHQVEQSLSDDPEEMFHDCLVHHDYRGLNSYCNRCGQKLNWKEEQESERLIATSVKENQIGVRFVSCRRALLLWQRIKNLICEEHDKNTKRRQKNEKI